MDDAEAARLQLLENDRQRIHRPLMDVVQQQDALALVFEPLHRAARHLVRTEPVPVVGRHVGAPDHQAARGGVFVGRRGVAEARKAEERRDLAGSPSAAAVAAMPSSIWALPRSTDSARKRDRMAHAVGADGVALVVGAPHQRRIFLRHVADDEIGRLDAFGGEDVENLAGVGRNRPVVEGEHHFPVDKRQRLRIVHRADADMLAGIDDDGAAGAERVRDCRGIRRPSAAAMPPHSANGTAHRETILASPEPIALSPNVAPAHIARACPRNMNRRSDSHDFS